MLQDAIAVFKRKRWKVVLCDLTSLVMLVFSGWLAIDMFFTYEGADHVTGQIFSFFALLVSPLWVAMPIYLGDIHVDSDGIGLWVFRKRIRYKKWTEIKTLEINEIIIRNYGFRYVTRYWLLTEENQTWLSSQVHAIGFDSEIPDVERLVNIVNDNIRKHGIPVVDNRDQSMR